MDDKIEMNGDDYSTRDGVPLRILCVDRKNDMYPVVAVDDFGELHCATKYGSSDRSENGSNQNHKKDIIKTIKQVSFMNVYACGTIGSQRKNIAECITHVSDNFGEHLGYSRVDIIGLCGGFKVYQKFIIAHESDIN